MKTQQQEPKCRERCAQVKKENHMATATPRLVELDADLAFDFFETKDEVKTIPVNKKCRDDVTSWLLSQNVNAIEKDPTTASMTGSRIIQEVMSAAVEEGLDGIATRTIPAVVFKGAFDVPDNLQSTPRDGDEEILSRIMALAPVSYSRAAGMLPVSCSNENGTKIDRSVLAKMGNEESRGSHGAGGLHDHTEHAQNGMVGSGRIIQNTAVSPSVDSLSIGMLRNPRHDPTTIVRIDSIVSQLPDHVIEHGLEPWFSFAASDSTTTKSATHGSPLFRKKYGRVEAVWNGAQLLEIDDPLAMSVIRWVTAAISDPANRIKVCLEPGDVLIMDNRVIVHGRDKPRSADRWFKRTFGVRPETPTVPAATSTPWVLKMDLEV